MKRVVITGIGVVSCLGNNQDEVYKSLLNSKSGITFSEEYKEYNLKSNVHGNTQGIAFKIIPPIKAKKIASKKFNPCVLLTSIKETRSMLFSI